MTREIGTPLPGIYFGMPFADYLAVRALSSSGMKSLAVHPMEFWATSWMNPLREESDTDAQALGRAYHCRIVEGAEAFARGFAATFDAEAHEGALETADDVKAELRKRDLKLGGSKAELIERLREAGYAGPILDELRADYLADNAGKAFLSCRALAKIEVAAAMIEKHPVLSKCFAGGAPEVTIIWDDADGVRKKARLDYLKPAAIVDLKTFGNPLGLSVEQAVYRAMASGKYVIQAAHYLDAFAAAREHLAAGRVHGPMPAGFTLGADDPRFVFVFQATGAAPVARAFILGDSHGLAIGRSLVTQATETYQRCTEHWGADPWLFDPAHPEAIEHFDDELFPRWMGD